MPYYITDQSQDCSGWAVVKVDGELVACHTTKQEAIDQAVAISLSEDEPFMGELNKRNDSGDPIIICDIDGTLINGGQRNDKVYQFVEDAEGELFIVTGRVESDRAHTEEELASLGIDYDCLIMNDGSMADSPTYKKATAEELLKIYNVIMAVENNETAIRYYRELGIDTFAPSDIPAMRLKKIASSLVAKLEPVSEPRERWIRAAWAIKAKIEGATDEARALGKTEKRTNHFEIRALSDQPNTFEGYASVFNSPSKPLPFTEIVKPGAFKRSLASRNRMMLLWNHDTSNPLASTRNGSLRLSEDNIGLKVTATLPDTTLGRDITELVRTGVIDSMSFGFAVKKDSWSKDGNTRYLEDVSLFEVSLVSQPAYEGTAGSVAVRELRDINPDQLADALLKLENGDELESDQAILINDIVSKLAKTEEVQQVDGDILALKAKKLKLLMMGL